MLDIAFLDASTLGEGIDFEPILKLGQVRMFASTSREQRLQHIGGAEVVITNKVVIDKEIMDACPNLRLICVAGTGMDNIDLVYAEQKGVKVKNAVGYSTHSVAQTTFALLLELYMRVSVFNHYVHSGAYSAGNLYTCTQYPFCELAGKTLGIIGMGNIGKQVAKIATAFGMKVCYYSTSGKNTSCEHEYERLELDDLLTRVDVLSVHAPRNPQTYNLIGEKELRRMKKTAVVLNTGRGGIVNERELAAVLDEGVIAGAGIDVFEKEPFDAEHPFMLMQHPERLVLTPHIAWSSFEARTCLVGKIAENICNNI
ncbi:MAG: D-2-hydroxyacid dehydrogenase [Paludibacteraceae bacterium]|nr:D-2-hydroxyacid dehydrogenase [Paludibacteraceae bacterium]MBO7234883.1 D-2-hydroxyacid dehydrogenase [Paludibacteraceae bacterium]